MSETYLGHDSFIPEVEAVFTNRHSTCWEEIPSMQDLSTKHFSIRCVMLGREISSKTYSHMENQLRDKRMLDLTGDGFSELSDAGIAELIRMPGLTDTLEAIFTDASNRRVTEAAMLQLKDQCFAALSAAFRLMKAPDQSLCDCHQLQTVR